MKLPSRFLNVDVELTSRFSLRELGEFLDESVLMLNAEEFFMAFEANKDTTALEDTICALVNIVEALPSPERDIWDRCEMRCFNIGIEAGRAAQPTSFNLSSEVVGLLGRVRGAVTITVYPAPSEPFAPIAQME